MEYDYSRLIGRIAERCGTRGSFAEQMGLSERSVSLKLSNQRSWKQPEIEKAVDVLDLGKEDIQPYFFTPKVQ